MLARNPAQVLGVEAGLLSQGAPGDVILVDPQAPWLIDSEALAGSAGNTPFDGLPVQGRVRRIFKGGRELG